MAKAIGHSMAALVATERCLWIYLSEIKEKDKFFLLDALLVSFGLFGDTVDLLIERYQEGGSRSRVLHPCKSSKREVDLRTVILLKKASVHMS